MDSVIAIIPTAGVMVLFFFVLRAIFRADRSERNALKKLDEQHAQTRTDAPTEV